MGKKRKPRSEDDEKLALVIAGLEKTYGSDILQTIGETAGIHRFDRQIPSGSINLDLALGTMFRRSDGHWQTGYPDGRIVEIFGDEGSGKTTMCLLMVANAQALGLRAAFLDMEHLVDPTYAQQLGVDTKNLYFSQPASGEQCMSIANTLLKSGLFSIIVIDSVAALCPEVEIAGETGDAAMGAQARLMSTSLRQMNMELSKGVKCNLVFTNQTREKVAVKFGSPKTTPGGKALKFYASVRIEVYRAAKLTQDENVYGQTMVCNVIKNKSAPPFRKAEFDLIFGRGIDYIGELIKLSVARGLVQTSGAWFSMNDVRLGQGIRQASEFLKGDPAACYKLYDAVLTAVMAERGYNPEGTPIPGAVTEKPSETLTNTFQPTGPVPVAPIPLPAPPVEAAA